METANPGYRFPPTAIEEYKRIYQERVDFDASYDIIERIEALEMVCVSLFYNGHYKECLGYIDSFLELLRAQDLAKDRKYYRLSILVTNLSNCCFC